MGEGTEIGSRAGDFVRPFADKGYSRKLAGRLRRLEATDVILVIAENDNMSIM